MSGSTSPLRLAGFRRLWVGGLVNDLGDWALLIALPVFVFNLTGSALTTSTVFVVELIAGLIAGQAAGVVVDRWDRRRILVAAGFMQAAALLPLLLVTSGEQLWIVYVVAAIESSFARLCGPAKAALVPSLVPPERLAAANGLNAVADNLARLVGSPLGGLAIQLVGLPGVVVIDAATYVLSSLLIAGIRSPGREPAGEPEPTSARDLEPVGATPKVGLKAAWLDGFRTIAADRRIATVLGIAALSQLAQGIFVVLFLVFVIEQLNGGGAEVGLIRGVQAIGGVLGGLLVPWLSRRVDARGLIGWGFVAFGAIALTTWNLPAITVALGFYLGLFIAAGIPGVVTSAGLMTTVQQLTPATHLGRVFATYEAGASIFAAIGVLGAGALADRLGVVTILNAQGLIYVACGVLALVLLRGLPDRPSPAPARITLRRTDAIEPG